MVPSLYVIAALALGKIIPQLERNDADPLGLDIEADSAREILSAVATQDPAFAMRTIVDIALRALSPAVNDPTTAVQALDALELLLLRLAGRDLGGGHLHDAAGRLRVVYPAADWDDLLGLACTEIRYYGAGAHQVTRRLRALLDGLIEATPSVRHAAVREQLALLDDAISRAHPDPAEQAVARVADHVGLGGHATGPAG